MSYVRFVLAVRDRDSGVDAGVFDTAYALRDDPAVAAADRAALAEMLRWFDLNLATPTRFNRSRSKGYYRRTTRGIAWFRQSASECLSRMHRLKEILEAYGHRVTVLEETRLGYVVYEDPHQVVAEPFADTRTGTRGRRRSRERPTR
ncbi:MAG: hypothetical protein AB1689_08325 [Thermodesulfobacteriota bacterium]